MNECVECGRETVDASAYCADCADRSTDEAATPTSVSGSERVASPAARAVAVLLAAAALLGGFQTAQTLQYLPQAIALGASLDAVGFLAVQAVHVTLLVAFAVMAKRLYDGGADRARYGRILRTLAAASVAFGTLVAVLPNPLVRWLPTVIDPGSVVLNVLAFVLAPSAFVADWQPLAVAVVGASISFAAGTTLQRNATR